MSFQTIPEANTNFWYNSFFLFFIYIYICIFHKYKSEMIITMRVDHTENSKLMNRLAGWRSGIALGS